MLVPESAFDEIISQHGTLSISQISQASTSHNRVREILTNKSSANASFPRFITGDFISGSYGRGTKTPPLDDIDVMMPIDGTGLYAMRNGVLWNANVRGSGATSNPLLQQLDAQGLLSSRHIMSTIHRAVQESYPNSTVAKDGQAVNVWFDSYGLGIDIVPCFHVIPADGSQDVYYIPAGSGGDGWIMTNPKVDQRISDALHERHNKKLKAVVKLLKIWNQLQNNGRLRPYHLEAISWYVFNAYPETITHPGLALMHFFQEAPQRLKAFCPDPTGIGSDIDSYLSPADRQNTVLAMQKTAGILSNAYLLGLADGTRQVTGWREVYGNNFARN